MQGRDNSQPKKRGKFRNWLDNTRDNTKRMARPRKYYDNLSDNADPEAEKNKQEALLNRLYKREHLEKKTVRAPVIFILIAFVFHFFLKFPLNFNYSVTWVIDVGLAIFVYLVILSPEEKNSNGLRNVLIVLFLEALLPIIIIKIEAMAPNKFIHYYLANRLLTPWWFYYAVIRANDCEWPDLISKIIKGAVIVFWIGVLFSFPAISLQKMNPSEYMTQQQTETAVQFFGKTKMFYGNLLGTMKEGVTNIADAFQKQIAAASGGYYTGIVDKNEDKPLGVYLEKIQPTAPSFTYDSQVSVYGNLKVMSLEDAVKLNLSCYYGNKEDGSFSDSQRADDVYPEDAQWYYNLQREQIDCMFTPRRLPIGNVDVTIQADFNFETMAYQKVYFMQEETKRSLIGQGKDPLEEYNIKDKNPKAVYTNGPVMIGMGVSGSQPVGVEENSHKEPRLGITVQPNTGWEGRIQELKELVIQVPDSMELDLETCNHGKLGFIERKGLGEKNIDSAVNKFKSQKTQEYETCKDKLGLTEASMEGLNNPHSQNEYNEFNECLRSLAEGGNVIKGYRKYRSSQFRDCQNRQNLIEEVFDDNGYIDKEEFNKEYSDRDYNKVTSEFKECLVEHAKKETEGYTSYYLNTEAVEGLENIEDFKTFSCRINITKPDEVLGGKPLAIHYLRAKARYQYELEKETNVEVKRGGTERTDDEKAPSALNEKLSAASDYMEFAEGVVQAYNNNMDIPEISGEPLLKPCLVVSMIAWESGGVEDAVGGAGEKGLMQVKPSTAEEQIKKLKNEDWSSDLGVGEDFNYDAFNPRHNIIVGSYYIAQHLARDNKDVWKKQEKDKDNPRENAIKYALAEYNAGPGNKVVKGCQDDKIYFSECLNRMGDDFSEHESKYTGKIWDMYTMCLESDFETFTKKLDEKDGEWKEVTKVFGLKYSEKSVKDCIKEQKDNIAEDNKELDEDEEKIPKLDDKDKKLIRETARQSLKSYTVDEVSIKQSQSVKSGYILDAIQCIIKDNEVNLTGNDRIIQMGDTKYSLVLAEEAEFGLAEKTRDKIDENKVMNIDGALYYNKNIPTDKKEIKFDEWRYVDNIPFVQFKLDNIKNEAKVKVRLRYMTGFVKNTGVMIPDYETGSGDKKYSKLDINADGKEELWVNVRRRKLTAWQDAYRKIFRGWDWAATIKLHYYDEKRDKLVELASIPWGEYTKYQIAKEPHKKTKSKTFAIPKMDNYPDVITIITRPVGFYVTNIRTEFGEHLKNGANIKVQVVYNTSLQFPCCKNNPQSCEDNLWYALGTCDKNVLNQNDCKVKHERGTLVCESSQ